MLVGVLIRVEADDAADDLDDVEAIWFGAASVPDELDESSFKTNTHMNE